MTCGHNYQAARTLRVLELLAAQPRSVPELAEAMEVQLRTIRRTVTLLAHVGYLERLPDDRHRKRYRVGGRGRALGFRLSEARRRPARRTDPHH